MFSIRLIGSWTEPPFETKRISNEEMDSMGVLSVKVQELMKLFRSDGNYFDSIRFL